MKTMFIPVYSKEKLNKKLIGKTKLPKNIAIAYSIQFKNIAIEIKNILNKTNNITKITQVLGCSKPKFPKNTEAILLITTGNFHGISLAHESQLPVYRFNNYKIQKISSKELKDFERKKRASLMIYLNAKNVGILVSTKPGQNNLKSQNSTHLLIDDLKKSKACSWNSDDVQEPLICDKGFLTKAIELKNKLKGKNIYLFMCNNVNTNEFENFPQIQSWINTACPRLDMDNNRIINLSDILKIKH